MYIASRTQPRFPLLKAMFSLLTSSRRLTGQFANGPVGKLLAWGLFGRISAANVCLVTSVLL